MVCEFNYCSLFQTIPAQVKQCQRFHWVTQTFNGNKNANINSISSETELTFDRYVMLTIGKLVFARLYLRVHNEAC